MSRWRSVWLVARREMIERGRSRGFLFSVAFTTLAIVAFVVLPGILFGDEDQRRIGVLEGAPAGLSESIEARGPAIGQEFVVSTVQDAATALDAGDVSVVVDVPADLSGPGVVHFKGEADPILQQMVASAIVELRTGRVLEASDVDMAELAASQEPPALEVIDPPDEDREARFLLANIGAILILVGVFGFGFTLLTGVVEEKQSRVVEVVLASVRARDLLMGKVLGIGILGLFQLAVFVVAALIAALVTEAFELPTTAPGTLVMLVVWFILGYTLYATVLGALGALASRMEEASNVSTPVTMVAMISYFVAIFGVIEDPAGPVAVVTSLIPVTAPFVVPLRAAMDAITPWELGLSIAIMVGTIWLLFEVGARIYTGAVLQTTGRMKLRDAWRAGR